MASTSAARRISASPAAQPPLPDELLEDIFLRLDRASAACSSFRRVVSRRRFLRRFRSLHPPAVLGFLGHNGIYHAEPPHRSAPAARALAQAADLTFFFLPNPGSWVSRDACDGRFLLTNLSSEIVVCDPLHRRYILIPPIPDYLVASAPKLEAQVMVIKSFLAPAGEEDDDREEGEESSFRSIYASFKVICTAQWENKVMAFVFSSGNRKWRGTTYYSSNYLTTYSPHRLIGIQHFCAHGYFFWMVSWMACSLMLDTREMKFSTVDLPRCNHGSEFANAIVEAGPDRLGFLTFGDSTMEIYCKTWRSNGVGAEEWQHDKTIRLPQGR